MLIYLHVKNFALIKELEINFKNGLTVLSGETGAGKSIIIGSMNAISGEKLDRGIIRSGEEYALIEMIFVMSRLFLKYLLKTYDIPYDESNELIVSRRYNNSGRSVYRVNGQTVTKQIIQEISDRTIDIHSQREHQSLLNSKNHIELLDQYTKNATEEIKKSLSKHYITYKSYMKQIKENNSDREGRRREIDFLKYEINEIESANILHGEDKQLQGEYKLLSNRKNIVENLGRTEALLASSEQGNIQELLSHILTAIIPIRDLDDGIEDIVKEVEQIDVLSSDLVRNIEHYLSEFDSDNQKLNQIQERIHVLNSLKVKYGNTIEDILIVLKEKKEKVQSLVYYDENIDRIKGAIVQCEKEILEECGALSIIRQKAAKRIGKDLEVVLAELNFVDSQVKIDVKRKDYFNQNGYDDVTILISTNKNEPVKPLNSIASGGELSRVMLAVKTVFAELDQIGTLVFDEIDSGISGRTAQMVGEKMVELAGMRQIICITHLPQISAMADQHYLIEKSEQNNRIETFVKQLSDTEIFEELARLIGGAIITDNTIQSAKDMKEQANQIKLKNT